MSEQYYKEAQKLAQKEYRACTSRGQYPFLPALDDFIPSEKSMAGIDLGLTQIPAEFIVGTKTRGRMNSFAANFMPLLAENTEFAFKWRKLCQAHLDEGIHDPIKVYEYMNRFYVEEGNKRVSVLKFFDAVMIPAQVIRIMPEANADSELYMEFVAFYRVSKVNYVEFSKKGGYTTLLRAMDKAPDEPWTDEDRRRFSRVQHTFREAFEAAGGKKLSVSASDAMLAYIEVYGYNALCSQSPAELKKSIARMWEEMRLTQEPQPIEVKLNPTEEKKESLLSIIMPAPKPLKVAFLHDRTPQVSGWTNGHELGRQHAQRVLEGKVVTTPYFDVMQSDPAAVMEQAIAEGNQVIFTTSPRLMNVSLPAAVKHPEVTILNCSLNQSHRYIRTYYARMYEAKYIIGAIAGALSPSGRLGYICDYPIFGQVAGINAFALGAQTVNPRAKVFLDWSSIGGTAAAQRRLKEQGVLLTSHQDMTRLDGKHGTSFGLIRMRGDEEQMLAYPVWQWGIYYEEILRRIMDKSMKSEYESSKKALNYYWGMSAGVVDVRLTENLPVGVRRLAAQLKQGVCRESCLPFFGPVWSQYGRELVADGQYLTPEAIMGMDELVENVIGSIPAYEQLTTIGRETVDTMGVQASAKHAVRTEE